MRLRKRVIVLAVTGLAATGALVAGVAVASPPWDGGKPREKVIERTAEYLGVEPERLSDALAKACASLASEGVKAMLQAMVEAGKLKQQEADDIRKWIEARPAAVDKLGPGFHRSPFEHEFMLPKLGEPRHFHHFRFKPGPGHEAEMWFPAIPLPGTEPFFFAPRTAQPDI